MILTLDVLIKPITDIINASFCSGLFPEDFKCALLKVHNDTNLNIDNGKVTAQTLLDLSAAFDTTDHDILVTRLSTWYGISGTALSWFTSYLTDIRQPIK